MEKKLDIFYFSSTHCDREWYQTFQGVRYRRVKMVDNLISLLDNDTDFETFHFDGQTIVLEDYLEISPEKKEKLKELIKSGKILIGPWYVMPDELLVSGESLIRNLQKGHQISKEWDTKPWKYGYVCDCFGHTPQMPQIFKGFDIDYSIVGRGTTEDDPTYFKWQSPDGSEVLTYKLHPHTGYGNFKCDVWAKLQDATEAEIEKKLKWYIDREIERCDVPIVIIMDGNDHSEVFPKTTDYIKRIAGLYPDANIHHVNLCEQGKLLEQYADTLPTIASELNKTAQYPRPYLHLITNTLSSYYPLKQQNDRCQNTLEKQTDPLVALAAMDGINLNHSFVKNAYMHLLQNHPHDSICGCSIDQVHKDMEFRFDQAENICRELREDYLFQSRKNTDSSQDNHTLTLFNTLPYEITKTVSVDLEFAPGYDHISYEPFGYENTNAFRIYDINETEIPYKLTMVQRKVFKRYYANKARFMDIHTITFTATIPACGKAEYLIKPTDDTVRYFDTLPSGTNYMENEFVRVDILGNGAISITDKKTGKTYSDLCNLTDDSEIGDGWYHAGLVDEITVNTQGINCEIERIENGPSRCVFRITRILNVPKKLIKDGVSQYRSEEKIPLKIVTEVGLSKENRYADIRMKIDNTACDHRMKLLIPTKINTERYFSSQSFCFVERNVGIDKSTASWHEHDQFEKATSGIFGKRNDNGDGIAFVSAEGLHEVSAYDDAEGTLAITLLRAFHKTPQTMGETRCQLQKELEYSFAIMPLDSDIAFSDLVKVQDSLATEPMSLFEKGDGISIPQSKLNVSGKDIVTSVIKVPENGEKNAIIIRVYNASGNKTTGKIELCMDIKNAEETNLNEETIASVNTDKNSVSFDIDAWKIKTFKICY